MAARFWVGGTGNWDASDTSHWSTTSGGASGAAVPTSSDDVTFDSNSGTSATVTITGATANAASITINKSDLTLTHSAGSAVTGTVTLTTGTLNTNGQTCSWGVLNSNNANTRTITLGASEITLTGSSTTVWQIGGGTLPTITDSTAVITATGSATVINLGSSANWGSASFLQTGSGICSWGTASTCANYTRTGTAAKGDTLEMRANATITGTFTCNGNSILNRINLRSSISGTARTITAATVAITNSDLRDITGAGAGSWDLSGVTGGSGDQGGNTNITFTTAAAQTWSGTTGGNWSTNAWTSRVPLPQDDVIISSAFDASQTITADMPRLGKSITWAGATGSPTWAFSSTTNDIYGSITLIAGMTISGTQGLTLRGRSSFTLTSAGKQFTQAVTQDAPGGTYTCQDAFSTAGVLTLSSGTFDANDFNITATSFSTSGIITRVLTMGGGVWTLSATGTVWSIAGTGLTINCETSEIVLSTASSSSRAFAGGGQTYHTLTYTVAGSTGFLVIQGSNTFNTINFSDVTNARSLLFTAGTTTTITGNFNVNGTAEKLMTVDSGTAATHTLSKSSGIVSCDYLNVANSIAGGGAGWYAGANSTDGEGNTGWIFAAYNPINYGSETSAQIASRMAGMAKPVSVQEAVATHLGILPVMKFSTQEMFAGIAGIPSTAKSVQLMMFENLRTALSLTDPYTKYSEQMLWTLANNAGLTMDDVLGS